MPEPLAVTAGLFNHDGGASLMGSSCRGCGAHFFPCRAHCPNPPCGARALEQVRLGRRGTLYSYTVQAYRPPPLFRMDAWAPYALGLVELPEGLRVLAMLTGVDLQALRIGMPLELVTEALYRDADGHEVHTFKYRPAAGSLP